MLILAVCQLSWFSRSYRTLFLSSLIRPSSLAETSHPILLHSIPPLPSCLSQATTTITTKCHRKSQCHSSSSHCVFLPWHILPLSPVGVRIRSNYGHEMRTSRSVTFHLKGTITHWTPVDHSSQCVPPRHISLTCVISKRFVHIECARDFP